MLESAVSFLTNFFEHYLLGLGGKGLNVNNNMAAAQILQLGFSLLDIANEWLELHMWSMVFYIYRCIPK